MTSRLEVRVGRQVVYHALDAEAAAVSDPNGVDWPAQICRLNADGSVNMLVLRGDATTLAKTSVTEGAGKGSFSTGGLGPSRP